LNDNAFIIVHLKIRLLISFPTLFDY